MDELIKITEQKGKQAVSARELHDFLESKKDFSTWIKNRIKKCGLIENEDYSSFTQKGEREIGGTIRIEYALSVDAAKELSMVEGKVVFSFPVLEVSYNIFCITFLSIVDFNTFA